MRYLATKAGTAHVIIKDTSCPIVKRNVETWKGQRSLKPSVVLSEFKDCSKCQTFEHARSELRKPESKAPKSLRRAVDAAVKLNAKLNNMPVADERTTLKAKEHAELAEQHGWSVSITANAKRGLTVIASKGDEICVLAYRENGILWNDEIVFKVPGRIVAMHNSGTWRRQVSLPEGKRPISARPKRFGRKKTSAGMNLPESANGEQTEDEINGEVIPLNIASLPFSKDDDDLIIVDAIKGMELFWRNNMMAKVVSARVPSKPRLIRFGTTGRAQRRYVSFPETEMSSDGEIYGPERSVAIEDMLRVRA